MENVKIPNHVAIILDGNGRWAKERGLKRTDGHKAGYENLLKLSKYVINRGSKYLSVFAFSTENFNRPKEEVDYLMNLFLIGFKKDHGYFNKENIRVVFSGKDKPLSKSVINTMRKLEEETKNNTKGTLNICLNYGGRAEIVDAVNKIIVSGEKNITEDKFKKYLYNDFPDIDFMIRTSGELRISNFMLWELSYAELYFPKCYFPDFNEEEYDKALVEYTKRDRRFGGLNKNE
jgi:undecaprenyl diphosphate synthase